MRELRLANLHLRCSSVSLYILSSLVCFLNLISNITLPTSSICKKGPFALKCNRGAILALVGLFRYEVSQ